MGHDKKCENCGAKFEPKVFWQKFCSQACKFIAYGEKQKKEALKEANKVFK